MLALLLAHGGIAKGRSTQRAKEAFVWLNDPIPSRFSELPLSNLNQAGGQAEAGAGDTFGLHLHGEGAAAGGGPVGAGAHYEWSRGVRCSLALYPGNVTAVYGRSGGDRGWVSAPMSPGTVSGTSGGGRGRNRAPVSRGTVWPFWGCNGWG